MQYDLVIRNGIVVDGTGGPSYKGDIAIRGDKIVTIGLVEDQGEKEIDATGLIITPGFVDIHTHYDGQITWENRFKPSSNHGVTTVVMGNCGVGFAPVRADAHSRDMTIKLMEGVEDIPEVVMAEGIPWDWETFPQYLDAVSQRPGDADFAVLLPHSPLRVYVMGERGLNMEPPTDEDLARMRSLTKEAVEAGAIGVSTSRNLAHRFRSGKLAPSVNTEDMELLALANGLKDADKGMFQLIPSTENPASVEFSLIRQLAEQSGRPVSFSLLTLTKAVGTGTARADWEDYVTGLEQAERDGLSITGQIHPKPIGTLYGLTLSYNQFSLNPSYREVASLPLTEKVEALRNPALRDRLLRETPDDASPIMTWLVQQTEHLYPLGTPCNYFPDPAESLKNRSERLGIEVKALIYDELLRDGGKAVLRLAGSDGSPSVYDQTYHLFGKPGVIIGLGDGGAHYGLICDASYTTFMLCHYGRDAGVSRKLPLQTVVSMISRETAQAFGLCDRGILKPGYKADLNIIDMDKLKIYAPEIRHDLPAEGARLSQEADGYSYTILSGVVTYQHGKPTNALPGRLIRGQQPVPTSIG